MPINLRRVPEGTKFVCSFPCWQAVKELAEMYGWQPAGTTVPDDAEWDGRYDTKEGQRITDADARNLAAALECSLPDIPNANALKGKSLIDRAEKLTPDEYRNKITEALLAQHKIDPYDNETRMARIQQNLIAGCFTPEQWASLNCLEKFAGLQEWLKNFIAYLRKRGCFIT